MNTPIRYEYLVRTRYRLRRVLWRPTEVPVGRTPENLARHFLARLNAFLTRYHTLDADNQLVTIRDELALALATGDGLLAAATYARRALEDAAWNAVRAVRHG